MQKFCLAMPKFVRNLLENNILKECFGHMRKYCSPMPKI